MFGFLVLQFFSIVVFEYSGFSVLRKLSHTYYGRIGTEILLKIGINIPRGYGRKGKVGNGVQQTKGEQSSECGW